ncbi:MAG: THUMP domain-containing protein [Acidimicrobiales bacterium]
MTIGLTARVARGLEWVAADEVSSALPGGQLTFATREVRFTLPELPPAVGALRTVDDVFVVVGAVPDVGRDRRAPSAVAARARRLDLAGTVATVRASRALPDRPAFDVVASIDGDRRFNRYDLEDALGATLSPMIGGPYSSRRDGAPPPSDLTVRVVVTGDGAEVMVRLGARPLHRRPWKHDTAPATLHPPAAAALLRLAGSPRRVVDPFAATAPSRSKRAWPPPASGWQARTSTAVGWSTPGPTRRGPVWPCHGSGPTPPGDRGTPNPKRPG